MTVKTLNATLKRAVTQTRERDSYTRYVGSFSLCTSWRAFLPDDALSKVGKNKLPSTQMISVLSILGVRGSTEKHFVKIKRYMEWTQ